MVAAPIEGGGAQGDPSRAVRLLRDAGGDAEPLPDGAVVAVFDGIRAAVVAALELHLSVPPPAHLAGRAGWRVGIDARDALLSAEGIALREAIRRATVLARIARPGTIAVMAGVAAGLGALAGADVVTAGVGRRRTRSSSVPTVTLATALGMRASRSIAA